MCWAFKKQLFSKSKKNTTTGDAIKNAVEQLLSSFDKKAQGRGDCACHWNV